MRAHIDALAGAAVQGSENREEAVKALIGLLENAQGSNSREWVMSALEKAGVDVARPARKSGHITRWRLMGPVPWDGRENPLDKVYAGEPDVDITRPVTLGRKTLTWREYVTELPNGEVDLVRIYGSREFEALYAYAEVDLSGYAGQDVLLRIGSNDGYKCWFNGQEAGRFDGGRSYRPGQDSITVRARAGINTVLLSNSIGRRLGLWCAAYHGGGRPDQSCGGGALTARARRSRRRSMGYDLQTAECAEDYRRR